MPELNPNWNLLPHDPIGFFELAKNAGEKELKKKYHALIKQFKPERFPDEFGKIRQAFETAKERLANGASFGQFMQIDVDGVLYTVSTAPFPQNEDPNDQKPIDHVPETNHRFRETTDSNKDDDQPAFVYPDEDDSESLDIQYADRPIEMGIPTEQTALRQWLIRELHHHSAEEIRASLERIVRKTPLHFFAMALLGDLESTFVETKFSVTLMEGLAQLPASEALSHLLDASIEWDRRATRWLRILFEAEQLIKGRPYFLVTVPIWRRLVDKVEETESVAQERLTSNQALASQAAARENLQFAANTSRVIERTPVCREQLIICLRILGRLIWTAPSDWIEQQIAFVEKNAALIPDLIAADPILLRLALKNRNWIGKTAARNAAVNPLLELIKDCIASASMHVDAYIVQFLSSASIDESLCYAAFRPGNRWNDELWKMFKRLCVRIKPAFSRETDFDMVAPPEKIINTILPIYPSRIKTLHAEAGLPVSDRAVKFDIAAFLTIGVTVVLLVIFADAISTCILSAIAIFPFLVWRYRLFRDRDVREYGLMFLAFVTNRPNAIRMPQTYWKSLRHRFIHALRGRIVDWPAVPRLLRDPNQHRRRADVLADLLDEDYAISFFALAQRFGS